MGVNNRVFASIAERGNFYKLSRQWGRSYRLYHNLPFLNVLNTKNLNLIDVASGSRIPAIRPLKINDTQYNRLKKTSIDYTLCSHDDQPIVCIEFDGLGKGHNVATSYHTPTPPVCWRQTITELKLRIAHASCFPFFVVGPKQFSDLVERLHVTIVDGIVGEVLSTKAARDKQARGFTPAKAGYDAQEFKAMPEHQRVQVMGEWFEDCELLAKYETNPIYMEAAKLYEQLLPELSFRFLANPLNQRDSGLTNSRPSYVGVNCTAAVPGASESAQVWLPNFLTPGLVNSSDLCRKTAQLIALDRLKNHREFTT